jgi:integrase
MIDNSGIYERKSKAGISLQIILRYGKGKDRKSFTKTIKVSDYPDKKSAYVVARMIRDKARIDISAGKALDNTVPNVKWFFEKELELSGLSIKTKAKHRVLYKYSIAQFEDVPLNKIKTSDIQQSIVEFAENHSNDSIQRLVSVWRAIYHAALMLEYEITDKTIALKNVKSKIVSIPRSTATDVETFNLFCDELLKYNSKDGVPCKRSQDIWYMLQIMRWTGCRTAEVLALNWNDFNAENKTLYINKSVGSTGTETRKIITTKTVESIRYVPCTDELIVILNSLRDYSSSSPMIIEQDGKPYEINDVSNHIMLVSKKCGIKFNAYMLRHLFSTTLYREGVNQAVIRDLMGHTSSSMTLGYANTSEEDRKKAINKIKAEEKQENEENN